MEKVRMIVGGREAFVDADQVKIVGQKQQLVARAMQLKKTHETQKNATGQLALIELQDVMAKIIRINRRIRQNIQFTPQ